MTEALTLAEALDLIDYLKAAMIEMSGAGMKHLPGFTRSESVVIRILVAAHGRTVTKPGLLNGLCQCAADQPDIKIVDVYVCKIRRKMRRMFPGQADRIRTEWGQGYSWRGPSLEPEAVT